MNEFVKLPPQAQELEQAVLGAMMLERTAVRKVLGILSKDSFYVTSHQLIFAAIHKLADVGKPVDIMTVTEALKKSGDLDIAGGAFYVTQLTNKVATSAHVEYHARIIAQKHGLREMARIGAQTQTLAYDPGSDVFDVLRDMRTSLDAVSARLTSGSSSSTAAQDIGALIDSSPVPAGYSLGIESLDKELLVQPGLPYVIAGRPGMGKSIAACLIAWHMTSSGDGRLFSPEMTLRQIQARIISSESGVPYSTILSRKMNEQQIDDVVKCLERIGDRLTRLHVDETPGVTPDHMGSVVENDLLNLDLKGFVVDHLHKMMTGDKWVDKDETPRVSKCMEGITRICKSTGLYGIVMCQLNREVEKRTNRRPLLSDLKQSGRIEEDAAAVVLLYRDGYYQAVQPWQDQLELAIAKNRDGGCSIVTASCIPSLNRIW